MKIAALIMAAGEASRFGACKHLQIVNGKTILQHLTDILLANSITDINIISGAWHGQHKNAKPSGAQITYNPLWREGLGSSIAFATRAIDENIDGLLIVLGDQAALQVEDIQGLLANFDGKKTVCATYNNSLGVPAIFAQQQWPALKSLQGDNGAKLILQNCVSITTLDIPSAAIDIDTVEDLASMNATI
jgi:molybdenum cofactor cytidylyltransferase